MDNRKIVELDLNDILPNRFQPRIKFNETSITELAESIREHGVIQPIVVRPLGDRYEIIAGERRYKASVLAGKETIPAIITELDDKDSAEVALIENVQRQDLTPIEEAISYKKILDMGYLTQEELAERLGKTQSTVANKLRLLNLDDVVQEALLEGKISERHARSLLKISNKEKQIQMLEKIINERLTVRRTDEEISKMMNENDNRNIEILDFGEGNIQNTNNNFNIPTSPIVEDISMNNNIAVNPAPTDILNNPVYGPSSNIEHEESANAEALLKPGKFFNLSDLENSTTESPVENTILTAPVAETAIPNSPANQTETNNNFIAAFGNEIGNKPTPIIPANPEPLVQTPIAEPIMDDMISAPNYGFNTDLLNTPITPVVPQAAMANTNNMKQAIDIIRECSSKLEALGFALETEEYDFEDMYQVIFKINK